MDKVSATLLKLNFGDSYPADGRVSVADIFQTDRRCGIYVLEFSDGELYVGQAVDVVRRYSQHVRVFSDIKSLRFKETAPDDLDEEERSAIWNLEANGASLRNVSLTSTIAGPTKFDHIMAAEDQARWAADLSWSDMVGIRQVDEGQRRKYARRFALLEAHPRYSEVVAGLRAFVKAAIPARARSEMSFWSCTCLPFGPQSRDTVLARVNIHAQEVFSV